MSKGSSRGVRRELTDFATNQSQYGNDLYTSFTHVPIISGFGFNQLACGDDFTLLLTNNGNVLSTGNGSAGQHCVDHFKPRFEFAAVGSDTLKDGCFEAFGIQQIAAGEAHCAALDKNGNVHLWGRNHFGECNEKPDITKVVHTPRVVKYFKEGIERKCLMVACGGFHTLILNQDNDIIALGRNDSGQLGLSQNEYEHQSEPTRVTLFSDKVITNIAAGSSHSVALTVEGYSYSWGGNSHGQLA